MKSLVLEKVNTAKVRDFEITEQLGDSDVRIKPVLYLPRIWRWPGQIRQARCQVFAG